MITRGASGSVAAYRDEAGSIRSLRQDAHALAADGQLDPTGCGDVFIGALGAGLLSGSDLPAALDLASRAGARNCTLTGIDDLHRLVRGDRPL